MKMKPTHIIAFAVILIMSGCAAGIDDPGLVYAPQMYYSTPYAPLSQITNKKAGDWVDNLNDGQGEFYNSNPYNPYTMTMRTPPANTIQRGQLLQYNWKKEELDSAAMYLESPYDSTNTSILNDGKALYYSYCQHCHGEKGAGDGMVADKYAGVANLKGAAYQNISEGHIYHVITHGKGLMGTHGSQISPADRWKIVRYVKELQKQ